MKLLLRIFNQFVLIANNKYSIDSLILFKLPARLHWGRRRGKPKFPLELFIFQYVEMKFGMPSVRPVNNHCPYLQLSNYHSVKLII